MEDNEIQHLSLVPCKQALGMAPVVPGNWMPPVRWTPAKTSCAAASRARTAATPRAMTPLWVGVRPAEPSQTA